MKRKSMQSDRKKTRERSRQRCGHCQQLLSHSQYHLHRRLYYNSSLDNWKTVEDLKRSSVPVDVPGSSSSESEFEDETAFGPATCIPDLPGSDSDDCSGSESNNGDQQDQEESDSLSDENSHHEDGDTDYVDSDTSDVEELLHFEDVELPQPLPPMTSQQHTRIILTWLVYFVLVWQYKNYVSDSAIEQVLKFVRQLLFCIGQLIKDHTDLCLVLATNLPTTLYSARKMLKIDRDNFIQYVVCPKCTKLYHLDDIVVNDGRQTFARTCEHVAFPRSRRPRTCGSQLARKVVVRNCGVKFYAIKTYCYKSISDSLESLLKRPGMEEACERWRTRGVKEDLYADVYDGKIWKQFGNWKGNKPFLNLPRSFGLMMNVDWFQPFKHRSDFSVGVIYMVLMNLPRSSRFKKENVILVGVIPALAHEPKSLNHFLEPAVNELNALWKGVKVNTYRSPSTVVEIQAAVLCCASDIPAARKLCGFLGHSAKRGCSHCYKIFPGNFGEQRNYSGFDDRDQWPKRTSEQHRRDANKVKNCQSQSASDKLASQLGCRYTSLLELPYYASIEMCVIDPMHNLFLGTAKRVFSKWIENEIITKDGLQTIQARIDEISSLSDIGRLPGNIKSNYGGYTAAQWKNFVLLFSMYALKDVLPECHLHYWQSFVLACRLLCRPCINQTDLMLADCKLLHFLKEYENINGELAITPNMHLHLHLKECVQNYGSIYGFWLFSFERYNGILGSYHTNNKTVEIQIMRKFMISGTLAGMQYSLPAQYSDLFLPNCMTQLESRGISEETGLFPQLMLASSGPLHGKESVWADLTSICFESSYKLASLDQSELNALRMVYLTLYPKETVASLTLATLYKKYKSLVQYRSEISVHRIRTLYAHTHIRRRIYAHTQTRVCNEA
ncbi:hypothetical protein ACROYT_G028667 [Oculina patagonica]